MTVNVDRAPRPPALTGDAVRDREAMYRFMRDVARVLEQLRERTGGATDQVATTTNTAAVASATAAASQAGATVPTPGGAVELNPSDPLGYDPYVVSSQALITVAQHTRTGAAAPLQAGGVSDPVERDNTYYVYYNDPANAGGAQTYLAVTQSNLATITADANNRIIGSIYIPSQAYGDRLIS